MGVVADVVGGIGDAIGGVTDSLFGGDPKVTESANFSPRSKDETKRLQDIEAQIQSLFGEQSGQAQGNANQFNKLFQDQLTKFMVGGSQNPNPTPEQLQQATSFVDQTFTNPAQTALQQYGSDFQSQAQARAAALGRNPNSDIATQQAIAGEIAKQGLGLQGERGSRIAQTAQGFNDQQYNRGLGSLNAGLQGGSFLNNLAGSAFNNRLNLLNSRSNLQQIYQNDRGQKGVAVGNSTGLLGGVTNAIGQISGASGALEKAGGLSGLAGKAAGFLGF